jgi:hypothetical protein
MSDSETADAPAERPKKRKKKRKRRVETDAPAARRERDASGADRPRFLLEFPADPELDRLVEAFEAGDYATVRSGAPTLAKSAEDPRVRDAALELGRRIAPDPLIRYLLFVSIGLLVFLVIYFYSHRH